MILAGSDQQCVPVNDTLTSPALSTADAPGQSVSACVQLCNEIAKEDRDESKILLQMAIDACEGDEECIAQAEAEHEARMEQIALDLEDCKRPCHEQGQGSGGQ
jgi:hypothetical protein